MFSKESESVSFLSNQIKEYQREIRVGILNRNTVLLGAPLWSMIWNKMIYCQLCFS